METIRILLDESDTPRQWYNLAADLHSLTLRLPGKTSHSLTSDRQFE